MDGEYDSSSFLVTNQGLNPGLNPGLIALDIDGTMIVDGEMDRALISLLEACESRGWQIAFITGRPFVRASLALASLSLPYMLAAINGSDLLSMPEERLLVSHEISLDEPFLHRLLPFEEQCWEWGIDYVLYGGYVKKDLCCWRPSLWRDSWRVALSERAFLAGESWLAWSKEAAPHGTSWPWSCCASLKSFGTEEECSVLAELLMQRGLVASVIRDPHLEKRYLVQATAKEGGKGNAVRSIMELHRQNSSQKLIAAGDDWNDWEMLFLADVKIVMSSAPEELKKRADLIAPPPREGGLFVALQRAIKRLGF